MGADPAPAGARLQRNGLKEADMKIVLLDDLVNVGQAGEVVDVRNGYARNFLLPKGLAERATADSLNRIKLIKRAAEVKRAKRMAEAAGKFALLTGKQLVIRMKAGTEGRIFGAVTSAMIADEVMIQFEVELDRRHIMLDEPIKHLGEFHVPLRASAEVTGEVLVVVEPIMTREERQARLLEETRRQEAAERAAADAALRGEGPAPEAEADAAVEAIDKYEHHEDEAGG
jgi:large subunit ribosomal protein L9